MSKTFLITVKFSEAQARRIRQAADQLMAEAPGSTVTISEVVRRGTVTFMDIVLDSVKKGAK